MPDRLTRALGIVLVLAVAGAVSGVAWEALWEAPAGVAFQDRWFLDPAGPDVSFSGTALYVLLAVPVGFVVGALVAMVPRHEAVTVGAVVVGSVVAAWLMYAVGHALGPPDPTVLAAGEPDFTELPSDLLLAAPEESRAPYRSTAFVAFPVGALAGVAVIYLSGLRRSRHG